jgi:glycerol-3-phosphate acyltransferase PlsY
MGEWWLLPVAYLVGSIPWGLLIVRLARGVDVRRYGSGSTGTTNVLRTAGKGLAILVLAADTGKGVLIVSLSRLLSDDPIIHAAVGVLVIAGHVWPIFAGFRGGRGVATGVGAAAGLDPLAALMGMVTFIPTVWLTRYVSLGSVAGVFGTVTTIIVRSFIGTNPLAYLWFGFIGGGMVIFVHRANIKRLLNGTERRLGEATAVTNP